MRTATVWHAVQVPQRNLGCPATRPSPSTHLRKQLLQRALQAQAHARQRRGWAARHGGAAHRARTLALAHCPALEAELAAVVAAGADHRVLQESGSCTGLMDGPNRWCREAYKQVRSVPRVPYWAEGRQVKGKSVVGAIEWSLGGRQAARSLTSSRLRQMGQE